MTLVEIMIATVLFAIVATGVAKTLLQAMRYSESNLAQSYAQQVAQSIIEQVISVPPGILFDSTVNQIEITLPDLNSANRTVMDGIQLAWNSTDYTYLHAAKGGVLADAAYIASSREIRPEKHLPMRVNLQRTLEASQNRARFVLRYEWAAPDRLGASTPVYLRGEIRTVRSMALRF